MSNIANDSSCLREVESQTSPFGTRDDDNPLLKATPFLEHSEFVMQL